MLGCKVLKGSLSLRHKSRPMVAVPLVNREEVGKD